MRTDNSLESEIRRGRLWACYLLHCHGSERSHQFDPEANISNLALPWPDEDFHAGISICAPASLESIKSNGGIFSELIRALTLW